MSGRGARGATPRVQAALGWTGVASVAARTEVAPCGQCGHELRFGTGEFGQTLEICTNRSCPGRIPHRPLPDPANLKKPYVPKPPRRRKEIE